MITAKSWHQTVYCCKANTSDLLLYLVINNSFLSTSGALFNISWPICTTLQWWEGGSADLGCPRLSLAWSPGAALAADATAGFSAGCLRGQGQRLRSARPTETHLPVKGRQHLLPPLPTLLGHLGLDGFCEGLSSLCLYLKDSMMGPESPWPSILDKIHFF